MLKEDKTNETIRRCPILQSATQLFLIEANNILHKRSLYFLVEFESYLFQKH